jgi:hypothetical protein
VSNETSHTRLRNFPTTIPFPACTQGFLYYHSPPSIPPVAGEVRFRLTPENNPELFDLGRDLHTRNGLPWRIPLLAMSGNNSHKHLLQLLLADGLVTPALMAKCDQMVDGCCDIWHQSRIVHSLGQLFPIDFPLSRCKIFILTRSGLHWLSLRLVQSKGYSYCGECINHAAEAITDRPRYQVLPFAASNDLHYQSTRVRVR